MIRLTTILFVSLFLSTACFSQNKEAEYRPYFKGSFQLPTPLANRSFNRLVNGISDIDFSFHVPVYEDLHMGLMLEHSYMAFQDVAIPERTNANLQFTGALLNIGYTFHPSEKIAIELDLNGGYDFILINSETCKQATGKSLHTDEAIIIKPQLGFFMQSSDLLSFGLTFSYAYIGSEFGPDKLCLNAFSGFENVDYLGNYQIFAVGFGFKSIIPRK